MMSVVAVKRSPHNKANPYVCINAEVAEALTIEQLGLLVKMLLLKDGWEISDDRMTKQYNVGASAASRVRKELMTLGHVSLERQIDPASKKFAGKAQWVVIEKPQSHKPINEVVAPRENDEATSPENHGVEIEGIPPSNSRPIPLSNIPSTEEDTSSSEKKGKDKRGKKNKADKPVDPDGVAINAIIGAWHAISKSLKGNPFQNETFRGYARAMHHNGITAEDVTLYADEQTAPGAYWHGKSLPFPNVADQILSWKQARPAVQESTPKHAAAAEEPFERITPERRKALQAEFEKTMAEIAAAKADLPHRVARQQTARKVPA